MIFSTANFCAVELMQNKVFITGGAGYIGSHTCLELLKKGFDVFVFDNLSNGSAQALKRIEEYTDKSINFVCGDITSFEKLKTAMQQYSPNFVIHFAGLKSVSESVLKPMEYYNVNIGGSINLLKAMDLSNCDNIIFSSSATVYGHPKYLPYDELHPVNPINPYGRTKLMFEQILSDWVQSSPSRRAACLRYFNPIGAYKNGMIGEFSKGTPNNLMPFLTQVALGKREFLPVFGDDYETKDGSGERDYIHVVDLAFGHFKTIEKMHALKPFQILNLGTGNSTSVKELITAFENASGKKIDFRVAQRRLGDIAQSWADPSLAEKLLEVKFNRGIGEMCEDSWRWQSQNPNGYEL